MERRYEFMISRNDPYGFALRTRKNLDNILAAYDRGADVHPVTQVTCSLMGIAVFPWEHEHKLEDSKLPIAEVFHDPDLEFEVLHGNIKTLGQLWRVIRNAVSHRGVEFSSDSRELRDVKMLFTSGHKKGGQFETKGQISIRGDQLLRFCHGLLDYIENR